MKKCQSGFVVWGLTYFLYASALVAGIIIIDKSTDHQAVVEQEGPTAASVVSADARQAPDIM